MDFWKIFLVLLNLALISFLILFSVADQNIFLKQVIFWFVGLLLFLFSLKLNYQGIFRYPYRELWIGLSIISLIIVLFLPGLPKSWIRFGDFSFQTSEFAKIGFLLILTSFLVKYSQDIRNPIFIIYALLLISPFFFLLFLQPDFGMLLLYFLIFVFALMPFFTKKEIVFGSLILVSLLLFSWFFVLKDYQKARILNFFNTDFDPLKSGYNLRQLRIIVGTAGLFGKGIGRSEIAKFGFLPAKETDFILTSLLEERGIFGFLLYVFLLTIILFELKKSQQFAKDPNVNVFLYLVLVYFIAKFSLTALINFGLFPIIGLPVPFLSAGGSHLIFDLWLLGISYSLSRSRAA